MHLKFNQTLAEVLNEASAFLEENGMAAHLARTYWMYTFDETLFDITRQLRVIVDTSKIAQFSNVLTRIANHEPIQYIVGYADFLGEKYKVTPDTLIPREDTEGVIRHAKEFLYNKHNATVVDIGTGTGIIAIALAKAFDLATIYGVDISNAALRVANDNAIMHHATVTLLQSDLLDQPSLPREFDLIVSNPPYISENEKNVMDQSVLQYEPSTALFAPNEGLYFYEKMAALLPTRLAKNGRMVLEIGYRQGQRVCALFAQCQVKLNIQLYQDLNGLDRYVVIDRLA